MSSWLPYHHDWKLAYQLEAGLRVHWFGRYAGYAGWSIPASRLAADMVCFFFVEKNSCSVTINGQKLALHCGDLLVISGADEFSFEQDVKKPHKSLSASLALQQGSDANVLLQRKFNRRYAWDKPEEYVAEFEKVLHALGSSSPHRDLEIAGALLHWLSYILTSLGAPFDRTYAHDRKVVDKILAAETWANARLKEVITLSQWAKAVGLNSVYFGRIFKRETGLKPMEWLNQRRLQMACQYLSGTRKSIGEIADACGFANQFYFSRVFRKQFEQSPMEYRKSKF